MSSRPVRHSLLPALGLVAGLGLCGSLGGGLAACAHHAAPPGPPPVIRYDLSLRVETSTSWRRLSRAEAAVGPLVRAPGVASPTIAAGDSPPAAPDPALAGPALAGPALADPALADPALADPALADPALADPALADPALADPVALALDPLGRTGVDAQLVLELSPSRSFRDGSLGWLLHFVAADGQRLAPGADPALVVAGPLTGWTLAGRSVELRTFPDGEILSVDLAEHLAGPDRLGGILDVLLPVLSPQPPQLRSGSTQQRPQRWPLMVAADRGWRHTVIATWVNVGRDPVLHAWHLRWSGPTEGQGRDALAVPPVGVRSHGQARGEVWLSDEPEKPVPLRVLDHAFDFGRDVEIEYPAAAGGPVRVLQHQDIQGHLHRQGVALPLVEAP